MARYRLEIRRSAVHRYGVFALADIPARRRIIEYTGKRLTVYQAWKTPSPKDIYIVGVNSRFWLDGSSGGSGAQLIAHSCQPNLTARCIRNHMYFFSLRKIRAGEELTRRYRYPAKLRRVACQCGAPRCRGALRFILS